MVKLKALLVRKNPKSYLFRTLLLDPPVDPAATRFLSLSFKFTRVSSYLFRTLLLDPLVDPAATRLLSLLFSSCNCWLYLVYEGQISYNSLMLPIQQLPYTKVQEKSVVNLWYTTLLWMANEAHCAINAFARNVSQGTLCVVRITLLP